MKGRKDKNKRMKNISATQVVGNNSTQAGRPKQERSLTEQEMTDSEILQKAMHYMQLLINRQETLYKELDEESKIKHNSSYHDGKKDLGKPIIECMEAMKDHIDLHHALARTRQSSANEEQITEDDNANKTDTASAPVEEKDDKQEATKISAEVTQLNDTERETEIQNMQVQMPLHVLI